uniref:Uncharacterized protein AlNc14C247G9578 n=1 Tax=Albugo laibachii Nc14 TaxID=890382 RepID=F0WT93_9STRA|nr:conserved hypothetical protein [Albugo laibachii Nc14]|eukprot:CCA24582.1 conserved hypothetical protein [Albugo laibachii Nc14]
MRRSHFSHLKRHDCITTRFQSRIVLGWLALTKMARTTVEGKSLVFVIGETEFVFASLDTQGLTAQSALQLIPRLGFYAMQENGVQMIAREVERATFSPVHAHVSRIEKETIVRKVFANLDRFVQAARNWLAPLKQCRLGSDVKLRSVPCSIHDPRCLDCNSTTCFQCVDLLLNSVQRSGARSIDEPLPLDEIERQFRKPFSFGTQDPHFFDDVESAYRVVTTRELPLNSQSRTCVQGTSWDATWKCTPQFTSHLICGHEGAFSFSASSYEVRENASNLTVKVLRTGGGYGDVLISYRLRFVTASPSDVSGSAFYTSSNTLLFNRGTIALSFVLTIHDDHFLESNETFYIELLTPASTDMSQVDASLGPYSQALVTILDDDAEKINPEFTQIENTSIMKLQEYNHYAGKKSEVILQAVTGTGRKKAYGGDFIVLESGGGAITINSDGDLVLEKRQAGSTTDFGNGTYKCTWERESASSNVTVAVYVLHSGGLRGEYYSNAWLQSPPEAIRTDAVLNFTWARGMIFPSGSDFVSVQWSGRIKPKKSGYTTFFAECDDHVRLYIDGVLLIDYWNPDRKGPVNLQASMELDSSQYYSIMIEYRDLAGNAAFVLSWEVAGYFREVIPAANLFRAYHVHQSPFHQVSIEAALVTSASTTTIGGDFKTVSGRRTVFTLFARDKYENSRKYHDIFQVDRVEAHLVIKEDQSLGGTSPKIYDAINEYDSQNSALLLVFFPLRSGKYDLNVLVNGKSVQAGPDRVHVLPGSLHSGNSQVSEHSLLRIHVAGAKSTMLLETRDAYRNRIFQGGNNSLIEFRAIHTTRSADHIDHGIISDKGDGTYEIAYTLRFSGSYNFHILWRLNSEMSDGPFLVSVLPDVPDSRKCLVDGEGVHEAVATEQNYFTIIARDANENDVKRGGSTFTVKLQWKAPSSVGNQYIAGNCIDLVNGNYTCTYVPRVAGLSNLHVNLDTKSNEISSSRPIANSPFEIHVRPGKVYAKTSMAFGEGLAAAVAGETASFIVTMRDRNMNVQLISGIEVPNIVILGPSPMRTVVGKYSELESVGAVFVIRTKDSSFRVDYNLERKGEYRLYVQAEESAIQGSPFLVRVHPNEAHYATSTMDLCAPMFSSFYAGKLIEMRLTTRDRFSNVLESGNTHFLNDKIPHGQAESIIDEGNGSYRFRYYPRKAGIHTFRPKMLLPNGIVGTYYTGNQLVDMTPTNVVLERLDAQINFDFGINPPEGASGIQKFIVHWSGYLLPDYSEVHTFEVEHLGTILAFHIDQTDFLATNLGYKGNSSRLQTQVHLEKNKFVKLELIFAKSSWMQEAHIRLLWSSYSREREVISNLQLYSAREVMHSPTAIIIPDDTSPLDTETSFGNNTIIAVAGDVYGFQIIARDQYGNRRQTGGDSVIVKQLQAPIDSRIRVTVLDYGNGTYKVDMIPVLTGYFSVVIGVIPSNDPKDLESLGEEIGTSYFLQNILPYQLRGSPFTLKTIPGEPVSINSRIVGPGAYFAIAGEPNKFQLELRDLSDNRVSDGGHTVEVRLDRVSSVYEDEADDKNVLTQANAQVVDAQDGTYNIHYQCNKTGLYTVQLKIGRESYYTRRYRRIHVMPSVASASTSVVSGTGIRPNLEINTIQSFRIDLMDSYDNAVHKGGDLIRVRALGVVESEVGDPSGILRVAVQDLTNGSYLAQYTIQNAGIYQVQIELARPQLEGVRMYCFTTAEFYPIEAATVQSLEPQIIYDAQKDLRFRGYQRIKWFGYLRPSYTESYQFQVELPRKLEGEAAILWLEDVVVSSAQKKSSDKAIDMVANQLYKISLDYFAPTQKSEHGVVMVYWKSDRQNKELIPHKALYPHVDEIPPKYSILATN